MKAQFVVWRFLSLALVCSMMVFGALPDVASSDPMPAGPPGGIQVTPLQAGNTIQAGKAVQQGTGAHLTSVIVKLQDASLATYTGGVAGMAATSPAAGQTLNIQSAASQSYLQYLARQQAAFEAAAVQAVPQAKVVNRYAVVLNGVSLVLPSDQANKLNGLPGVKAVYPDLLQHPTTDNSPQFIGAPTVWGALGGQESAGENIVVGVIDTGIWPEHPSFEDPDPSGKAYPAPPPPRSGTRACQFTGVGANPGPAFTCNNKLIGARAELATYNAVIGQGPGEFTSARDDDGHGTHTSSTAAGNAGVQASIFGIPRGTISGIAPRAHVIMYKALGAQGGFDSDLVKAAEDAILDGVNAINYSIGGGAGATPYADPVSLAFLDADAAGVFVSMSGGNNGPGAETVDNRAPWVITVAASTQNRAFESTATVTAPVSGTLSVTGATITAGITTTTPITVPVSDPLCLTPFPAGSLTGKVVVCKRGTNGRAEKGYNALQGGAKGMILYNNAPNITDLETDNHWLPAIHIQFAQGVQVVNTWTAHPNDTTVTWPEGQKVAPQGDVMASFSSRGGPAQEQGVSKPDITAPGVEILAGHSPQHLTPAQGGVASGPEGQLFQAIAGTSMSSPHIAGAGALLKALHPTWTPGQIKSALMTTAFTGVVKENGSTPATPFDDGSGRVDLSKAGDPGLTFDDTPTSYVNHENDLWNTNYPSIYVPVMPGEITVQRRPHSTLGAESTWSISVSGKSSNDFQVQVPAQITVPANGDMPFDIKISGRDVPLGQTRFATLVLTETGGAGRVLHLPIAFNRNQAPVTLAKDCTGFSGSGANLTATCTITATNTAFISGTVQIDDQLPAGLTLITGTITSTLPTAVPQGNGVRWLGTLAAALPPIITVAPGTGPHPGYLALSSQAIPPLTGVGDETMTSFSTQPFVYGGETYTQVNMASNGYVTLGTDTTLTSANQHLPDPTPPNNVLAPFWTDLNPDPTTGAGQMYAALYTSGTQRWLVFDWEGVKEFSSSKVDTFEVWVGLNGVQDVTFSYSTLQGNGDLGKLTVGAENRFGSRGANHYYSNGAGTTEGSLPTSGFELKVNGAAGATPGRQVIKFKVKAAQPGTFINYASLTSTLFGGTEFASSDFSGPASSNKRYLPFVPKDATR